MTTWKLTSLVGLIGAFLPTYAAPVDSLRQTFLPLPSRIVTQAAENGTYIENIAVRSNGGLLVTLLQPSASVYAVEDPFSRSPSMSLVHTFEGANGLTGISETSPDTFVVAAARYPGLAAPYQNTSTLWELKLNNKGEEATVHKIVHIPEASLLNGIVTVPSYKAAVLVGDSVLGVVFRVDVTTGRYDVVLDIPELKPIVGGPIDLGVNGVKIRAGYLYWSNTDRASIYRFPIDMLGYPVQGAKVEQVAAIKNASGVDDFALDRQGNIWAATDFDNMLITIQKDGRETVVLGSPTELTVAGDTSVAFGRTPLDRHILYVTTSGAAAVPVNGTIIELGKIVAVDTRG
ncbi:hypothetical protein F4820DRAFT_425806 [Hypoxylon rubiginosum]|uniref:Uncharacterized protein n=1 Tax=Hypoxylon rubiginosum TaxID=110542 RepID=A0ACB9YX51_9PEZI|nr:hypothetical protein F4820DRAFT_425806 [Hypoxylon rubiginosum]